MGTTAFDHPWLSGLLGDAETRDALSPAREIAAMLAFEVALAEAQARHGLVPEASASGIRRVCSAFTPDMAALAAATSRDGVVVPELVRQLRQAVGAAHASHVHLGATSQDVIDTALMLRLKPILVLMQQRLGRITDRLDALNTAFGTRPLMGRTRMQAATPITVADRLGAWRAPLASHAARLAALRLPVQFGGATGTLAALGHHGPTVRGTLADLLGLADLAQWHTDRTLIMDIGHAMALITGSLGKLGQDVALMAQMGEEIALSGGGGSSAMPHKQNPVAAEMLVALARFTAGATGTLQQAMVHEQERSGAAWTVEWLVLPQMVLACGGALRLAEELLGNIRRLGPA
ncbi:3-carboxy-cis,cis-muconate cycloisomerase [Azorhizobium oxalatiphilum]|uniref:3-carboxy-cis,cis-muconate cycloisomerase n=1 Tax=Azorhizobium oxalatiphilum TaxID=980631 RepID=A0A917BVE4_9HYPH|nr:3-carboxy-cis,cis-muconate cycloisomerase [Azorhizobium oxalatiphilum]GGF58831.1 3-carboxy-cis,cis-muconate cycloisomerase [Azorhizobium oxalatiphilum]